MFAFLLVITVCVGGHMLMMTSALNVRISTMDIAPFYSERDGGGPRGFLVDLMQDLSNRAWDELSEQMQYRFQATAGGGGGSQDQLGQWNGVMGDVIQGRADIGMGPVTMTKKRYDAAYFSHPFMTGVIVPMVKKPGPGGHMPFTNLTDLHAKQESRQLSVGYIQHGSTEMYLATHKLPIVRAIYNASKAPQADNPYVTSYTEAVRRIRDTNGKFVFFGEHTNIEYLVEQQANNCDLTVAWAGDVGMRYYGFVFPRSRQGYELMEKLNRLIMSAEEDGTIATLRARWWEQKAACPAVEMCLCHEEMQGQHNHHH